MSDIDPVSVLEAAIERAGSQNQLSRQTGLPQGYLSQVLRRKRPASDELLAALGLERVVVRSSDAPKPITVKEAELSVRTGNIARRVWGDDMLLRELCSKTDDELKTAGFMRKSIKEIREIGKFL